MKENANERFGRSDVMGIDHLLSKRKGAKDSSLKGCCFLHNMPERQRRTPIGECAEVAGWIDREDRLVDERNPSQMERRGEERSGRTWSSPSVPPWLPLPSPPFVWLAGTAFHSARLIEET